MIQATYWPLISSSLGADGVYGQPGSRSRGKSLRVLRLLKLISFPSARQKRGRRRWTRKGKKPNNSHEIVNKLRVDKWEINY